MIEIDRYLDDSLRTVGTLVIMILRHNLHPCICDHYLKLKNISLQQGYTESAHYNDHIVYSMTNVKFEFSFATTCKANIMYNSYILFKRNLSD